MSTMQRLTLIGLYNYEQTFDRDLFSGLELPEHYDKPTFINALLLEHGEKCVMYSDPNFFKSAINIWSKKWALELSRIYDALIAEYNPIYNYDRYEDWTETDKPDVTTTRTHNNTDTQTLGNTITRTHNDTDTRTNNNTDTQTNRYDIVTEQNVNGFNEHTVSADNSSGYQPESKDTSNSGKATQSNDGTITDAHTGTITDAHTGTITDANSGTISDAHTGTISDREAGVRSDVTHSGHTVGNIGVTTSASMVTEIVRQRFEMNLYGIATKLFANELLIGIY